MPFPSPCRTGGGRSGRALAALLLSAAALASCNDDTVRIEYRPAATTSYSYRSEVSSSTARLLTEDEPVESTRSSTILADHTVISSDDDTVLVEVGVRRDREAARSYVVRFDRGAQLVGIELVDGVALDALGGAGLDDLLTGSVGAPPSTPMRPGDAWPIDVEVEFPGADEPVRLTGEGRLIELGKRGDTPTALVETQLNLPVTGTTEDGRTSFRGVQRTTSNVTYDLVDGSVVAADSITVGDVSLLIQPPIGVIGAPVEGALRYEIETETERTAVERNG